MACYTAKNFGIILSLACLLSSVPLSLQAQGQSWQCELPFEPVCWIASDGHFDGSRAESLENTESPLTQCIREAAEKIHESIALAALPSGAIRMVSDRVVDLPVVIANSIDKQLCNGDHYWSYYEHCDRWGVSLGNSEIIRLTPSKHPVENVPTRCIWKACLNRVVEKIQLAEFQLCENLGQLKNFGLNSMESAASVNSPIASNPIPNNMVIADFSGHIEIEIMVRLLNQNLENQLWYRGLGQLILWANQRSKFAALKLNQLTDQFLTTAIDSITFVRGRRWH